MERKQRNKEKGNGEGTLYKSSKTGLYVGQYVANGKRHSVYQKKNEKIGDFKKRFNDILSSINTGTYIEKSNETFISILEKHIEQKYKDNITGSSSYSRDINTKKEIEKTCNCFVNKPIQKITIDDIEYSKEEIRKYSNNSINKIWQMINKTFQIAISRRKIIYNPMDDETLAKPISDKENVKKEALTSKEEKLLIKELSKSKQKQYKQIVLLQLNTGMRIGEILALSKDCIDLKANTITVYRTLTKENGKFVLGEHTKTYNRKLNIDKGKRTFVMTPKTRNIIKEALENKITNINSLLFWDYSRDSFILPRRINNYLNSINSNNTIQNLTSHKLRHTFITRCQEKGIPLVVIQAMVGHIEGSTITNDTYTTVSLDFMEKEIKKIS